MNVSPSNFSYPRGASVESLRIALVALVDQLNRQKADSVGSDRVSQLESALGAAESLLAALDGQIDDILDLLGGLEGSGLTPQQVFELSLVTATTAVLGSVSRLVQDTMRSSEQAAEATIRALIKGRQNEVGIRVEQSVRQSETEALAQQVTTLDASLAGSYAELTEEITARVTGDNALSQSVSTLTSALNGNVAQVQVIASSVDGIETKFGISINSQGQVTGLVQLDGTAAGSTFTVVANNFLVAQPSTTGGDPVPVFEIADVNGTTKLALRGDMLIDGIVLARHVAASAITADKIAANAITAAKIAAGAITAEKLAATLVTTTRIMSPDGKFDINLNAKYIDIKT